MIFNQLIELSNRLINNEIMSAHKIAAKINKTSAPRSKAKNSAKSSTKAVKKKLGKPSTTSKKSSANKKRNGIKASEISARDTLLKAAKKLFARRGLSGTSIRDIAFEAKINSSMISYYFSGKEGLYIECLKEIGETHLRITQQILEAPKNEQEFRLRLRLFLESLFSLFLEDREAGLIIIREYDRIHSPAEKVFKESFLLVFDQVVEFFKMSQKSKLIRKNKDPFILASLFFGAFTSQMRLDHIKDKMYKRSLKDTKERQATIECLIDLFVSSQD